MDYDIEFTRGKAQRLHHRPTSGHGWTGMGQLSADFFIRVHPLKSASTCVRTNHGWVAE